MNQNDGISPNIYGMWSTQKVKSVFDVNVKVHLEEEVMEIDTEFSLTLAILVEQS